MAILAQARPADSAPSTVAEPGPPVMESTTAVAVVMDFVDATLPQYDRLLESMRLSPGGPGLPGSIFQWSRRTSDGVRVTEVWDSQRHFEDFLRVEVAPRLSDAGLREPEITTYEVHGYLTQGPTVAQTKDAGGKTEP